VQKYNRTRKELEYYRGKNQVMINQIERAAQESSSFYAKLAAKKEILNRSEQVHISFCFLNIRRIQQNCFYRELILYPISKCLCNLYRNE